MRLPLALALALALAATFIAGPAHARTFTARATHVTDGDTVWVQPTGGGAPRELRIAGIDAPEICQPHGEQARDALARKLGAARLRVVTQARDDYGRTVARIERGSEDIGGWMTGRGLAWSQQYRGRGPYLKQQAKARRAHQGLWARRDAMEPRLFRRMHGRCEQAAPAGSAPR
jgi:micrococcal nuclease